VFNTTVLGSRGVCYSLRCRPDAHTRALSPYSLAWRQALHTPRSRSLAQTAIRHSPLLSAVIESEVASR
jgi:hypothetical protein